MLFTKAVSVAESFGKHRIMEERRERQNAEQGNGRKISRINPEKAARVEVRQRLAVHQHAPNQKARNAEEERDPRMTHSWRHCGNAVQNNYQEACEEAKHVQPRQVGGQLP